MIRRLHLESRERECVESARVARATDRDVERIGDPRGTRTEGPREAKRTHHAAPTPKFVLPDGWASEERALGNVVLTIIERAGIGAVTVDFERRSFCPGYGWRRPFGKPKHTGRGWRDRLIADAVNWLGAL